MHSLHPVHARPAVQALANSLIREVANSGMGRSDIVPFWFGESDQTTAPFIREAAIQSLQEGETFYAQNLGRPWLRQALADYLSALHGQTMDVERLAVVNSGVSALLIAAELLLSAQDRVVAITPLWPNVCEIPKILGAEVVRVPLGVHEGRWSLDLDRLLAALTPDTRALIVNSPNNPTGWMLSEDEMTAIVQHCRRHGIWIISDDVYERLVYNPALKSAPSFLRHYQPGDRIISVNSCSKAWSMTGWRAGWMVLPPELAADAGKIIEYNFSCLFDPVQRAMAAALSRGEAEVARLRAMLGHSRQTLTGALTTLPGVEVPDSGGAMYVFFRIHGHEDSMALAKALVQAVGLGLAPGSAFGAEGQGWLRWCHAVSDDAKLLDGVGRLQRFLIA
ncbi:aspartate/methionine/tyrosine aminotransferase [Neisseria sp. HSC-16F19]|nr:pyridoxal phosphate-dependent aminotransferase [Neisseria sp. HSC-16F19]MCP2039753.1 aspartate/methionine/tyrosine aminotransferase [Neisseria sp. HSC-16F19]